jgi:hypothetical protein
MTKRSRTPGQAEGDVRMFRHFSLNPDKQDWYLANVP